MSDKEQQQTTQQPTEDTREVQKGGILPEGWGEEDKPEPSGMSSLPFGPSLFPLPIHLVAWIFLPELRLTTVFPDAYLGKYGNAAGDKIQGTLGKVGEPLGKGLGFAAKPVGGLVEPLVGGVMKSGSEFNNLAKEEYGKPNSEQQKEELKKGLGGKDQDGGNPLGL